MSPHRSKLVAAMSYLVMLPECFCEQLPGRNLMRSWPGHWHPALRTAIFGVDVAATLLEVSVLSFLVDFARTRELDRQILDPQHYFVDLSEPGYPGLPLLAVLPTAVIDYFRTAVEAALNDG